MRVMMSALISAVLLAGAPEARSGGLENETKFNDGLLIVAVAEKIRRGCDDIGVRFFTARGYLESLKDMASGLGYSDDQIEDYVNDKSEQNKMRLRRNVYIEKHGADPRNDESLCRLGRTEIANNSQIGRLLKAK